MKAENKSVRRFAKRIRALRLELGMTQEEFAEHIEINVTYLGRLEREERSPSLTTLSRIASCLKMTISELCDGV